MENSTKILSPEEKRIEFYGNNDSRAYDLDEINLMKEYAEYYHQSMLQQSIPKEEEGKKLSALYKLAKGIDYKEGQREAYEAGFKAAINHLTKTK